RCLSLDRTFRTSGSGLQQGHYALLPTTAGESALGRYDGRPRALLRAQGRRTEWPAIHPAGAFHQIQRPATDVFGSAGEGTRRETGRCSEGATGSFGEGILCAGGLERSRASEAPGPATVFRTGEGI